MMYKSITKMFVFDFYFILTNFRCSSLLYLIFFTLLFSGCYHDSFTILNTNSNKETIVKCQDYYYEEVICTTSDYIYTIYSHYHNKKTYLSQWDMEGKLVSKYEFHFNHRLFLFRCQSTVYDPIQKRLYYAVSTGYDGEGFIYQYDLNSHTEKILYSRSTLSLKTVDEDHVVFIITEKIKDKFGNYYQVKKNGYMQVEQNTFLKVLNTKTGNIVCSIELGDSDYSIEAVSNNKEKIVISGTKSFVVSLKNKKVEMNLNATIDGFGSVAWSKDDSYLFYIKTPPSLTKTLMCLDVKKQKILWGNNSLNICGPICVFDKNSLLFSSFKHVRDETTSSLHLLDIRNQKIVKTWNFSNISSIFSNPPSVIIGNSP